MAEYAIILSIYTLELDKREYQINQATQNDDEDGDIDKGDNDGDGDDDDDEGDDEYDEN